MSIRTEMSNPDLAAKEEGKSQIFYPWRRFLARTIDLLIYDVLWSCILAFVFHVNLAVRSGWGSLFDSFVIVGIMLVVEPIWLHFFATTPGKAIFGLKITSPAGRKLLYLEGLERTWGVIRYGMGYNIPIYILFRFWKSYKLCKEEVIQPWDEGIIYTLKDTKWYRSLIWVGAFAGIFALFPTITYIQELPPNRGDLTVAQFVENYNYYSDYLGIDFGDEYLAENGKWAGKAFDSVQTIELGINEKPEFVFTINNGYLTGVSFAVEIKDSDGWIEAYDKYIVPASLAFACAQKEVGLFSQTPGRITELIVSNSFKSFHFEEAGITFSCDTQYAGYQDNFTMIRFLIPEENEEEKYFSINFSMMKNKL